MKKKLKRIIPFLLLSVLIFTSIGCRVKKKDHKEGEEKLRITCTTSMIRDAVERIAGKRAEVIGIMGAGVDPHLYRASQGDLKKLRKADIIFYNGLHLEGKMQDVLEKLGRSKPVIPVSRDISKDQLLASEDYPDAHDPHIWFDIGLWRIAAGTIRNALTDFDKKGGSIYDKNAKDFRKNLDTLHRWTRRRIHSIPEEQRVMVTAHDAFRYFGEAYDIEVKGLQGLSTTTEHGLKDVTNMVEMITERNIRAVFVESSVPDKPLKAVIRGCREKGHKVSIGGTLYSDAMGKKGTPEGTYFGMVEHNVKTIMNGLK